MKKYLALLLTLCCALAALFPAYAAEPQNFPSQPVVLSEERPICSTPRPNGDAVFYHTITDEAVALSTELYNNFIAADPELFIWSEDGIKRQSYWDDVTDEQIAYIRNLTESIVADCTTSAEEIYAVAEYLAQNVCYDIDCLSVGIETTNLSAYTVLTNEYTVCSGYAVTYATMMQLLGYPCVYVSAPDHAWNMIYNGERWMLIDVTWMSESTMENGIKTKSDRVWMDWYDFTIEQANSQYNHTLDGMPLMIAGGVLSEYPVLSAATEYTVPDGVTTIGVQAFIGSALETVDLGNTLVNLEYGAFGSCESLASVSLPDTVEYIGEYAFGWCPALETVDLGNGVITIDYGAFYACDSLTSVTVPNSTTSIGEYAFSWCPALETVNLGNSLVTIGNGAFYVCESLASITLPNSVTSIGDEAFAYCSALGNADLGNGVISIGHSAFYACESMTSVYIPVSVTSIDQWAFDFCSSLESVYYGGSYAQWQAINIADWNDELTNATIYYDCAPVALNGLVMDANGTWWYYVDNVVQVNYTGLVQHTDGNWYYVENGALNWGYTGLAGYFGTYFFVNGGVLDWGYTGVTEYGGVTYFVVNGQLIWGLYGLVMDMYGNWYYLDNSMVAAWYTGLVEYGGAFYYVENGVLNFGYTGLAEYCGGWYYVTGGVLDWTYTGLTEYYGNWYFVNGGVLDWGYTGLTQHTDSNWYYVSGGVLNFGYTGLTLYNGVWFYVAGGVLDWSYTGAAMGPDGNYYNVVGGVVVF